MLNTFPVRSVVPPSLSLSARPWLAFASIFVLQNDEFFRCLIFFSFSPLYRRLFHLNGVRIEKAAEEEVEIGARERKGENE